jgi:altronate dehydratase small subunit
MRKSQTQRPDALVLNEKDNVATMTRPADPGEQILVQSIKSHITVRTSEFIDTGHKLALVKIRKGDPIIKFGEVIGQATREISPGEHVHSHNVRTLHGKSTQTKSRV